MVGRIAEDLEDIEEAAKEILEIKEKDYSNTVHVEPEYNASKHVLRSYIQNLGYDEEIASKISEEVVDSNEEPDKIENILADYSTEYIVSRREALGATFAAFSLSTLSYFKDVEKNKNKLKRNDADQFTVPHTSYHEEAVRSMLNGENVSVEIYNLRFDNLEPRYDERQLVDSVESAIGELESAELDVEFENVNATLNGWLEANEKPQDPNTQTIMRINETLELYKEIIYNNGVGDEVNPKNSLLPGENTNMANHIDEMIKNLSQDSRSNDYKEIKVVVADFEQGEIDGLSSLGHFGDTDWALIKRLDQDQLERIAVHEIGHKLGLTHTKFPDFKRSGLFPDVMSYSDGSYNIPHRIQEIFDESYFGPQSHYNWERVKSQF